MMVITARRHLYILCVDQKASMEQISPSMDVAVSRSCESTVEEEFFDFRAGRQCRHGRRIWHGYGDDALWKDYKGTICTRLPSPTVTVCCASDSCVCICEEASCNIVVNEKGK
jgi:hypothetical protein